VKVEANMFIFGCGAVQLTKKEIEGFMRFRAKYPVLENLNDITESYTDNVDLDELEEYITYKRALETPNGKLYSKVVSEASGQDVEEADLKGFTDAEIKALFKYADHINNV